MTSSLTAEKINALATRKGVKSIAVRNFLSTLGQEGPSGKSGALRNLYADAQSYRWNAATQAAIQRGIELYFKSA